MSGSSSMTDREVQLWVQEELEWTPGIDSAGIGVSVEDGAVRLSGQVASAHERSDAMRAASRVQGVTTVIDDLAVRPPEGSPEVSEEDVAAAVRQAIAWVSTPPNSVRAEVTDHHVLLLGEVQWNFQRERARRVVERVPGVLSVESRISLIRRASAEDTAERIRHALVRTATVDGEHVHVAAEGTRVVLTGRVRSWLERSEAETVAWASPHVEHVENRIVVSP